MKHLINDPAQAVREMLQGFAIANEATVELLIEQQAIVRRTISKDHVALISGGGSGHEPGHFGYVNENLLTAAVHGPVFVPPSKTQVLETIRHVDRGQGILVIVKNFTADLDAFLPAVIQAKTEGIAVTHVIVDDDVSVANDDSFERRRRGVAGTVLVHRILGKAASEGQSLKELKALGERLIQSMSTLGVALTPASVPGQDAPLFELHDEEVYFGVGIHGEAGYRKAPMQDSERIAVELVNKLKSRYRWKKRDRYVVLVNGLGGTTLMEQYIFTNDVRQLLQLEGLEVSWAGTGNWLTSLNMRGISLTMMKVEDHEWLRLLGIASC
ncbi:DhaKLM operon coactivator DhaQ [Salisediminibacterium beveridgei]|uniref:DhaKLM operon coactivator DhaQ n=1 Tax=Salisediminibacterium beveridgei TaxID=632773 RepID=A0A1D7QS46_9BACI|nr:DhaKLM operon coactivator DhaQ [Salisediminibacterium beveridgei]AOM81819.1 DhaKLM operon coactivator dhaQ [Salisediminibacterium beveridgei]